MKVAEHATPKAMTLHEIKDETLKDPILQKVSTHIRDNTWHKITGDTQHAETLKKYREINGELTVSHTTTSSCEVHELSSLHPLSTEYYS